MIVLSWIVPATPRHAPFLLRFLRSLADQVGAPDFEVVIGADGGDDGTLADVAQQVRPAGVVVRIVDSPRPAGPALAHRNHARNQAMKVARGEYFWVVDCDFVWEPHAVAHAITLMERARQNGRLIALSPVLLAISTSPEAWLSASERWASGSKLSFDGDVQAAKQTAPELNESLPKLLARFSATDDVYSGFGALRQPGPPVSEARFIPEGFPCMHRSMFNALGGFDERYLGWGGNKEELCRRINALRPHGLSYEVLRSVAAWHQPHPPDPKKSANDDLRRANQARLTEDLRAFERGAPDWSHQVERVRRAIQSFEHTRSIDPMPSVAALSVGLITLADPTKGIARDMENIADFVTRPRPGRLPPQTHFFVVAEARALRAPERVVDASGSSWSSFLTQVDVLVFSEILPQTCIEDALRKGKRVVYLPNADWSALGDDVSAWISAVLGFSKKPGFLVLAKTEAYARALHQAGVPCRTVPWIAPDPVVRHWPHPAGPVRFFASLGGGGWRNRRGADVICKAWKLLAASPAEAKLTLKTVRPLADQVRQDQVPTDIQVVEGVFTRAQQTAEWAHHDVVLYPNRWDGFGLSLSEALNAGRPCLVPDAWPMNEQVRHGHNGLVFSGEDRGQMRLAPYIEPDPRALAEAMRRLIDEPDLLARLTAPHPGERIAQQTSLAYHLQELILHWRRPRALIVHMEGMALDGRRAEQYWCDALVAHGISVHMCPQGRLSKEPPTEVDFALVSKVSIDDVAQVRRVVGGAPIICWHHDLTDYSPSRWAWQQQLAGVVDLTLLPEGELERFKDLGQVATLLPGTRPDLQRPAFLPPPPRPSVVFLGSCEGPTDERVIAVRALQDDGIPVHIHGPGWERVGLSAGPVLKDGAMGAAYAGAIALCVSRGGHQRLYTSDRLFNAAGAGAVPLVREFPVLAELYPPDTIATFGAEGPVAWARALLAEPELCRSLQKAASAHTWRHHTWHDRIRELLNHVDNLLPEPVVPTRQLPAHIQAWEDRARKRGRLAVGHIKHTEAQCIAEEQRWWNHLAPLLQKHLRDDDIRILDHGCGAGRFTVRLMSSLTGKEAFGVDVSPTMVKMANALNSRAKFQVVAPSKLPFPNGFFHCIWSCTVLQHIPDSELDACITELRRVAAPGALVVLFENTHLHHQRTSASGHVVFRRPAEYESLFQGVKQAGSLVVEREEHTILVGRWV